MGQSPELETYNAGSEPLLKRVGAILHVLYRNEVTRVQSLKYRWVLACTWRVLDEQGVGGKKFYQAKCGMLIQQLLSTFFGVKFLYDYGLRAVYIEAEPSF
jgi:hypothetical protein